MTQSDPSIQSPRSSDLAQIPKLFVLYIAVLATPFFFILVWADGGPPFSLFTNLLIYLLSIPTVGFLDYLAITHFWRPQAQQQEGSLVMATWTIQGLLSMLAGTRLVASRLQEVEASSKIRIPVIVFLCLIAILVKLAGIVGEFRRDLTGDASNGTEKLTVQTALFLSLLPHSHT